jgi:putative lipoic acid-binding regulatory protein
MISAGDPMEFPCRFPIKAMGPAHADMAAIVLEIVGRHAPGLDPTATQVRTSSGGKWLAVTVVIEAESRAQLDAIYQDLTAHESVVWAL